MALPLLALPTIFSSVATFFLNWFIRRSFADLVTKIVFLGIIITMMITFTLSGFALINSFKILAPPQFAFAFGFIPSSVAPMFGAYLTFIAAKRVLDYKTAIYASFVKGGSNTQMMRY